MVPALLLVLAAAGCPSSTTTAPAETTTTAPLLVIPDPDRRPPTTTTTAPAAIVDAATITRPAPSQRLPDTGPDTNLAVAGGVLVVLGGLLIAAHPGPDP